MIKIDTSDWAHGVIRVRDERTNDVLAEVEDVRSPEALFSTRNAVMAAYRAGRVHALSAQSGDLWKRIEAHAEAQVAP